MKKGIKVSEIATVAQMAEHLTRNEDVGGSTPPGGSKTLPVSIEGTSKNYCHKGGDHLFV